MLPVPCSGIRRSCSTFLGRIFSNFSRQIVAVAVGWQVYQLTGSAFQLGMVGLMQFLPTAVLTFLAGHTADNFNRKRVVQICQWIEGADCRLPRVGNDWRLAHGVPHLHRIGNIRRRDGLRTTGRLSDVAGRGAQFTAATRHGSVQRRLAVRDYRRTGAGRIHVCDLARSSLCTDGRVLAIGGPVQWCRAHAGPGVHCWRTHPAFAVCRRGLRPPQSQGARNHFAGSVRRACSAGQPPCFRYLQATCCTSGRWAWDCFVRRLLPAH